MPGTSRDATLTSASSPRSLKRSSRNCTGAPPPSLLLPLPMSLLYTPSVDNSRSCTGAPPAAPPAVAAAAAAAAALRLTRPWSRYQTLRGGRADRRVLWPRVVHRAVCQDTPDGDAPARLGLHLLRGLQGAAPLPFALSFHA
jgi:hypothetical protein